MILIYLFVYSEQNIKQIQLRTLNRQTIINNMTDNEQPYRHLD